MKIRACCKGGDTLHDVCDVDIPSDITGFGDGRLARCLAQSLNIPTVKANQLAFWIVLDGLVAGEEPHKEIGVPQDQTGWKLIKRMQLDTDVLLVAESKSLGPCPSPLDSTTDPLPERQQNYARLDNLYLTGNCEVRKALQEVCLSYLTHMWLIRDH